MKGVENVMKLFVVATPIGNLEDITLRALRVLGEVQIIAAEDTRKARHLLLHHRVGTNQQPPRVVSFFAGNEASRTEELLAALQEGSQVAVISEAGMPGVSDPGHRLVAAARASNIPVEVVPGPCAAITALVGSGLPTDRFLFMGFLPRKAGQRQEVLGSLLREPGTLVFYEAPDRLKTTLEDLVTAFGADRPACVARELTKVFEEYRRGPLGELLSYYLASPPRGEVTLVVGGAARNTGESNVDLEKNVRERLSAGQAPREIAAALSLLTGQPRRKIYNLALSIKGPETDLRAR